MKNVALIMFDLALALVVVVLALSACRTLPAALPPPRDDLERLQRALDEADRGSLAARFACTLVPDPDQRRYCDGAVDAVSETVLVGRQALASAENCRAAADVTCLVNAEQLARQLLGKLAMLRGGAGEAGGVNTRRANASSAPSAPPPEASAAPAPAGSSPPSAPSAPPVPSSAPARSAP